MKISRRKVRRMVRQSLNEQLSLREGGNWGNTSTIKDFKMSDCNIADIDPSFANFLSFFESDRFADKKNFDKNSFMTNFANAMAEEPAFINDSFKELFRSGGGAMKTIQMMGALGVGSGAFCELATELSQKFSKIRKQAERSYKGTSSLGYQSNKPDKEPRKEDRQYYFNSIIMYPAIKQASMSSGSPVFKSVDNLKSATRQSKLNGFDAIILQMFMPNTVENMINNSAPFTDIEEASELTTFITEYSRLVTRSPDYSNAQLIEMFKQLFISLIKEEDKRFPGENVKQKRMKLFVNFIINSKDEVNELFSGNELAKSIIAQLKRIEKFTT